MRKPKKFNSVSDAIEESNSGDTIVIHQNGTAHLVPEKYDINEFVTPKQVDVVFNQRCNCGGKRDCPFKDDKDRTVDAESI